VILKAFLRRNVGVSNNQAGEDYGVPGGPPPPKSLFHFFSFFTSVF
jgi:hypothetical protein